MQQYLDILKDVMKNGIDLPDRTGVGRRSVFQRSMRLNLQEVFPIITTKKVNFNSVKQELLWFLRASQDNKELQKVGVHIWDDNADAPYWKPKAKFEGDLGRIYGVQQRKYRGINDPAFDKLDSIIQCLEEDSDNIDMMAVIRSLNETRKELVLIVDQLAWIIENIKKDPHSRRHVMTAWNPAELNQMALPPCHDVISHFFVAEGKLSYFMYQRSCDMFLGVPFNISSSSLLLSMIAQVTDLEPYEFIYQLGDAHIYLNHFEQVKKQLLREPLPLPTLWLNPDVKNIDGFKADDIQLIDYRHHQFIKAEMAV